MAAYVQLRACSASPPTNASGSPSDLLSTGDISAVMMKMMIVVYHHYYDSYSYYNIPHIERLVFRCRLRNDNPVDSIVNVEHHTRELIHA